MVPVIVGSVLGVSGILAAAFILRLRHRRNKADVVETRQSVVNAIPVYGLTMDEKETKAFASVVIVSGSQVTELIDRYI